MSNLKTEQVINFILDNPELTSSSIARELEMTNEQLFDIYNKIKGKLPQSEQRTLGKSKFFYKVLSMDVLSERDRVEKFMNNDFVFPDTLELHLGMTCQCACVFCWRWIERRRKEGELGLYKGKNKVIPLDLKDVESLLNEFKTNGGRILYLSGGLEFFTSNLASDVIRIASENELIIRAYTNGVSDFFEKEKNIDLILAKLEYIRFSLHAFKSESYAKVQMPHKRKNEVESEFKKVNSNIKKIIDRRKKYNSDCKIYLGFLVIGDNYLELEDSINYWRDVGIDSFDVRFDMIGEERWFTKKQESEIIEIMCRIKEKREHGDYEPMEVTGKRQDERHLIKFAQKCYIPFKKPTVDPWGSVFTCCYGAHPSLQHHQYFIGKYPENTLYQMLKDLHNKKIIPRPHCGQCTDWEITYNQAVEKVITDWKEGFQPEMLPF